MPGLLEYPAELLGVPRPYLETDHEHWFAQSRCDWPQRCRRCHACQGQGHPASPGRTTSYTGATRAHPRPPSTLPVGRGCHPAAPEPAQPAPCPCWSHRGPRDESQCRWLQQETERRTEATRSKVHHAATAPRFRLSQCARFHPVRISRWKYRQRTSQWCRVPPDDQRQAH